MRIVFLTTARDDLVWFRRYYEIAFPDGTRRAQQNYHRALGLLRQHPFAGRPAEVAGERELMVQRTPFALRYRVNGDQIEVLHLDDRRSNQAPGSSAGEPDEETDKP